MRYVICVFVSILLLVTACGDGCDHSMSYPMLRCSDSNTIYSESWRTQSHCPDTLVLKIEALNIEVLETCFNLNYIPIKTSRNE